MLAAGQCRGLSSWQAPGGHLSASKLQLWATLCHCTTRHYRYQFQRPTQALLSRKDVKLCQSLTNEWSHLYKQSRYSYELPHSFNSDLTYFLIMMLSQDNMAKVSMLPWYFGHYCLVVQRRSNTYSGWGIFWLNWECIARSSWTPGSLWPLAHRELLWHSPEVAY